MAEMAKLKNENKGAQVLNTQHNGVMSTHPRERACASLRGNNKRRKYEITKMVIWEQETRIE
jgi:hypothetical protein